MAKVFRIVPVTALLAGLGIAAGAALGASGHAAGMHVGTAGLRLAASATPTGVVVKALGAGTVTFRVSPGLRATHLSKSSVRIDGVELATGAAMFRVVARAVGAPQRVTLGLNRRKNPPTTTTVTAPPTATTTAAPPAPVRGAAAPSAPSVYAIPAGATTVSSSAELAAELAKPAHDIVLADGDYTPASSFSNPNGNRIYAAHLGKAVLHAGITLGGNYGPGGGLIQGVAFDVTNPSLAPDNAIVDLWGAAGVDNTVLDSTFDGHGAIGYAIRDTTPEGFTARRIVARNFTNNGISVDSYPDAVTFVHAPVLTDIDVTNVSRPVPKSSNGTSEACVWLGTQVTLTRAKLRNCAWMGLWTGFNGTGATYSDVDVDGTPTGIYIEHFTTSSTFQNIHIGTGVRTGITCEWDDPAWNGKPASVDNLIQDSLIESSYVGVYMDEGTTRTRVQNTTFRGQSGAAIDDYKGVGNTYSGNDYTGIGAGAVAISTAHL